MIQLFSFQTSILAKKLLIINKQERKKQNERTMTRLLPFRLKQASCTLVKLN